MIFKIHPADPQKRKIQALTKILQDGGVVIYPTDSVYGLGCDFANSEAVDKICKLRGLDPVKANLTFICKDISQVSEYTAQMNNDTFRLMKRNLPGPFTFILRSNNAVPKMFKNKKRTVGVRIPSNNIAIDLVEELGRPILSTSLKADEDIVEYFTDPRLIEEKFGNRVDAVIDGGIGNLEPSAVVDCTGDEPLLVRPGVQDLRL
ncbi:MAG TPA: L-threonylcarbamoyladenylate synthase [Bacteroidales bacterium]|nr:L-threonylcarbamoyladenylate synthase [Bacteroidales bacterium]